MATTAKITQNIFLHHIFRPLTTVTTSLSFSLLKTKQHPLFFSSKRPLFCSIQETKPLEIEENETKQVQVTKLKGREVPNLTVKEKKEICSYANSLGDKLKSQQVGKSGVTNNSVFAFDETLEANELLKVKIHRTCPGELEDIVRQLELATGSVVVGQIGRTVIFYRSSITKLNAEKRKEQARKLFAQKREKAQAQAAFMKREQFPRQTGRVQYGNRRSDKAAS